MATSSPPATSPEDETIPAFAVIKSGVVLKNIFLNAPPPEMRAGVGGGDEEDPPVLIGRHPDCHVVVDHPSISRFHLEVRSRRRLRQLTVTDRSSMHGTWVSGKRIPPNTPVDLVAGDTLRLGASRREYRLHWLSLREAYELEDPLPPLPEEDKEEESHMHQEANQEFVADESESLCMRIHQEASQQFVAEQNGLWAEEIPQAPPLPKFTDSLFLEELSLPQFEEDDKGVTKEDLADENSKFSAIPPISESVGSSCLHKLEKNTPKDVLAPILNAERVIQSDKRSTSSILSRRSKSKSVGFLRVHTGRSKERNSVLSYDSQKEGAQNENAVGSENYEKEGPVCRVLFDNWDVNEAEENKELIAQKNSTITHVSGNIAMEQSEKALEPLISKELMHYVSHLNLEDDTFLDKENSVPNTGTGTSHSLKFSVDAKSQSSLKELVHSISSQDFDIDIFSEKENALLDVVMDMGPTEPISENHVMQDAIDENIESQKDTNYVALSPLNLDGSLFSKENVVQNTNVVGSENSEKEGTICRVLFDNLDIKEAKENEPTIAPDNNTTPYISGSTIMERSQEGLNLKPFVSNGLMDSISPLNLDHDIFSDNVNSMLNIAKETKPNEFISENHIPQVSVDAKLKKSQKELMQSITPLDFKDDIFSEKEKSVLGIVMDMELTEPIQGAVDGNIKAWKDLKNNAMSLLNLDKENVTPDSRELKPNNRRAFGARKDNVMSGEYNSNKRSEKGGRFKLSAKSICFETEDDVFYSDKENLTPVSSGGMKARRHLPKSITSVADQEQHAFYSDKENLTPASSVSRKPRDMSETRARIEREVLKKRVDRVPFQTLLTNSPLRHTSSFDCDQVNVRAADLVIRLEDELNNLSNQVSDRVGEGKKAWTMVTDTNCLLDDESRKSIMLLQGIKGTHLIVPRIVIRELDCMKKREGLFRRSSKASSILQWIEDCMEKESWWMHVQSSSGMLSVAPTPPATPTAQCNNEERECTAGNFNPMSFFSGRSFTDIVSPTTEDHVLDCALLFNKLRSNEKIVILSNSITLKIKALSEGLLCEAPKEFRETLMNPSSNRFMWAGSMPRGSAWSCLDEAALAENFYNSHHSARRIPRAAEAVKGLKLILLHNSLFGQQMTTNPVMRTPSTPLA